MRRLASSAGWAAALLFPVALSAQPSAPTAADGTSGDPASVFPLAVVFVPQGPLLCGPAALEMALRHAGVRGVYARDFQDLVRAEEGGVRTTDLAAATRELGWTVRAGPSDLRALEQDLAAGRPLVVLLEDAPGRYHYVLVVGSSTEAVVFHDPARGPGERLLLPAFRARWEAADRWALTLLSGPGRAEVPRTADGVEERASSDPRAPRTSGGADEAARAEAPSAPSASDPDLLEASRLFRASRWEEAAVLAERSLRVSPVNQRAWEVLATSRYLAGDHHGALDAWNHAQAPRLDLVRTSGLVRTRATAVHGLMGLRTGEVLTVAELVRARRRLALLPGAAETGLSYRAVTAGMVEAEAVVIERPLLPGGSELAGALLGALTASEVSLTTANALGEGERATLALRWSAARPSVAGTLSAPAFLGAPGVARVDVRWDEEHHRLGSGREAGEARLGVRLALTDWGHVWLRWELGAGLDRWAELGKVAVLTGAAEARSGADRASVAVAAEGGVGTFSYLRWTLQAEADLLPERGTWTLRGRGLAAGLAGTSPRTLLHGAGNDGVRPGLLRAHALERAGRIEAGALGRSLLNGSLEAERVLLDLMLARVGVAAFLDAARLAAVPGAPLPIHRLDGGVGLRLRLPGGSLRLDAARGSDGSQAFSALWETNRR